MGFMDELKKLARPYAEDDDDFDEELDSGVSNRSEAPVRERYSDTSLDSGYSRGSERSSSGKVVNIRTATQCQCHDKMLILHAAQDGIFTNQQIPVLRRSSFCIPAGHTQTAYCRQKR